MEGRRARKRESFAKASDRVGIVGAHFLAEHVGSRGWSARVHEGGREGSVWPPGAVLFELMVK